MKDKCIDKRIEDVRVLRRIKRELEENNKELWRKLEMSESRYKEQETQNVLEKQRAKEEAEIKQRIRLEEEERERVSEELKKKRTLEKEFEEYLNYKRHRQE